MTPVRARHEEPKSAATRSRSSRANVTAPEYPPPKRDRVLKAKLNVTCNRTDSNDALRKD